jgi:hypothetical protein
MIKARERARVRRWCDWVDEQLAAPTEAVFVHGDFHPDNQLWDPRDLRLLLVVDFETSGVAEPEYDFRAIPSFGPGIDLLSSAVDEYFVLTGRRLSIERIMALHVRTTLGDALWRSEAGLPLLLPRPGGGTPDDYVDELAKRFALLGIETQITRRGPNSHTRPDTNAGLDTTDGIGLASRHERVRRRGGDVHDAGGAGPFPASRALQDAAHAAANAPRRATAGRGCPRSMLASGSRTAGSQDSQVRSDRTPAQQSQRWLPTSCTAMPLRGSVRVCGRSSTRQTLPVRRYSAKR